MANLKLNVKGQIKNLIPVSGTTYKFIIQYYDQNDVLLSDPELIQNAEVTTILTANTFDLNFPIADGDYSIENVKVILYNNSIIDGCVAEFIIPMIDVNCNVTSCIPEVTLTGTPSQVCDGENVTVNGTSLVSNGGTTPYEYAFIKTLDFVNVGALTWGTTKIWTGEDNTSYRIYTRGASPLSHPSCFDFIEFTTINCGAPPTECSPIVTITGSSTQSCFDVNSTTINGTNLIGNGGNGSYLWAIVKESDFSSVGALTFSSTKVWIVDHLETYRVYVKDTSGINDSTCYSYVTIVTQDCSEFIEGDEIEITLYYNNE